MEYFVQRMLYSVLSTLSTLSILTKIFAYILCIDEMHCHYSVQAAILE